MPRAIFNNSIISTVVPVSHVYLGDNDTDFLRKSFTGMVKDVRLTIENQYGQTWDLQYEIAEDVDFLPNREVMLLEDYSEYSRGRD